jgi:glycine betaine/proline transport system ATP-binding protein
MSDETVIEISNVWKIFGDNHQSCTCRAIREEGWTRRRCWPSYNAAVGVADVSLSGEPRRDLLHHGPVGQRQVNAGAPFQPLLEPTAGKILIEGTDVMALGPKELQTFRNRKIGMVFQNFALMPHRSVLDNVAMPLEIRQVSKNDRMRQAASDSGHRRTQALGQRNLPMNVGRHAATRGSCPGIGRQPGRAA